MKLSVVLPIYNEAESLPLLLQELTDVLDKLPHEYEIIAVNDGSRDTSREVLAKLAARDPRIKVVNFLINAGQTAALRAGFDHAQGQVLIPMDSDLENNPGDIAKLLGKLEEGYDAVSGWRKDRWRGSTFTRRVPSVAANWLISTITGVHLHDHGCTLLIFTHLPSTMPLVRYTNGI